MPKREAWDHPKIKGLARAIGVERNQSFGLMCCIWHKIGPELCPEGNIGKYSNEELADELDWRQDADLLIEAMVRVRLLDTSKRHRLIIHDWPLHCEDSVHAKIARARKVFADGSFPKLSKLDPAEREVLNKHYLSLKPEARRKKGGIPPDSARPPVNAYPSEPNQTNTITSTKPEPTPRPRRTRGSARPSPRPDAGTSGENGADVASNLDRNGTGPVNGQLTKAWIQMKRTGPVSEEVTKAFEVLIGGKAEEKLEAWKIFGAEAEKRGVKTG